MNSAVTIVLVSSVEHANPSWVMFWEHQSASDAQNCGYRVILIIPLLAVARVALVIGLMWIDLIVSVGTINGLIFYANILRGDQAIFFPQDSSNSFLSVFISWLNLDLGTETCFYDGLDSYAKTWFQFLFPLYIWFLVISIIVSSHYSTKASRLSEENAVQVLATLYLLSYAKLLRIIITSYLFLNSACISQWILWMGVALWWQYWLFQWETYSSLHSCSLSFYTCLSTIHSGSTLNTVIAEILKP